MLLRIFLVFFVLNLVCLDYVFADRVGPILAQSELSKIFFLSNDNDNKINSFATICNGFELEDYRTTCTFESFFPVSGSIKLNGGTLYLNRNLTFDRKVDLKTLGMICGNNHSIEFHSPYEKVTIPSSTESRWINGMTYVDSELLNDQVFSVAWTYDDAYIAAGTRKTNYKSILSVYLLDIKDGLSSVVSKSIEKNVLSIDWHPSEYYLAVGSKNITKGYDAVVYKLNTVGESLDYVDGVIFSEDFLGLAYSVKWSPTGLHLAVVSRYSSYQTNLNIYSFSGDLLTNVASTIVSSETSPISNSLAWSPDGNYIAVGLKSSNREDELKIYSFSSSSLSSGSGSSLIEKSSVNVGKSVYSVDWTKTSKGSFIVAGLSARGRDLVRIYRFNIEKETLFEEILAREGENKTVYSVNWSPDKKYLLLGLQKAARNQLKLYSFDDEEVMFSTPKAVDLGGTVYDARWSHNQNYLVCGDSSKKLSVYNFDYCSANTLSLKDVAIMFNSDVTINAPIEFSGKCFLRGKDKKLTLGDNGQLIVQPDSKLIFENIKICNVKENNLRNMYDTSSIVLSDCDVNLTGDYTFSTGSLIFDKDVLFTSTYTFNYTTKMTSTINKRSSLILDQGMTFSYDPCEPRNDLLSFTNQTSILFLNGATLHVVETGLNLMSGSIFVDKDSNIYGENKVTMSNDETVTEHGTLILGNNIEKDDFNLQIFAGVTLDVQSGMVIYRNVGECAILMSSSSSKLKFEANTRIQLDQTISIGDGRLQLSRNSSLTKLLGKRVNGSVNIF